MVLYIEPRWYDAMLNTEGLGPKTVEGRLFKPKYEKISSGDVKTITFVKNPEPNSKNTKPEDGITVRVLKTIVYDSFADYLRYEGLARTLPGVTDLVQGLSFYRKFYYEVDERKHKVLAIRFERLDDDLKKRGLKCGM